MKVLVIGGGVFGTSIACELSNAGHQVTLVEKNDKIMQGASKVNHNRVHFGYHYPRSPGTARQCLDSLPSFLMNYGDAVISDFPNYYAIASEGSFITPEQFVSFCNDVRIDFREEYPEEGMMNKEKLSASFKVQEPIFSTRRMAEIIYRRLSDSKVDVLTSSVVESAKKNPSVGYSVMINGRRFTFDKVVNASYSGLNVVNNKFGVRPRELRFERTVVPVFKFNSPQIGLTVMDGPFCTIMPHGDIPNEFLLWHVDGCVLSHATSVDNLANTYFAVPDDEVASRIFSMSSEFMPFIRDAEFSHLMKTTKTVYENKYDARVSEVHTYEGSPDFVSVLSGKIMCASQIAYRVRAVIQGSLGSKGVLI